MSDDRGRREKRKRGNRGGGEMVTIEEGGSVDAERREEGGRGGNGISDGVEGTGEVEEGDVG